MRLAIDTAAPLVPAVFPDDFALRRIPSRCADRYRSDRTEKRSALVSAVGFVPVCKVILLKESLVATDVSHVNMRDTERHAQTLKAHASIIRDFFVCVAKARAPAAFASVTSIGVHALCIAFHVG